MKKVRCPKCGKAIKTLENVQSGTATWTMNNKGGYNQDTMLFDSDGSINDWICPECNEALFTNEEEAINFLQGGIIK